MLQDKTLKVEITKPMSKNTVEVNGQRYDARTGAPVAVSSTKSKSTAPKHLDGFVRRPGTHTAQTRTEKSKTLMRSGVKKPAHNKIHAATKPTTRTATTTASEPHEPRVVPVSAGRAIRAKHVAKSELVSKFGKAAPSLKLAVVPVKEPAKHHAPARSPAVHAVAAAVSSQAPAQPSPFQAAIENAASHTLPKLKKAKLNHRVAKKLHVSPRLVSFTAAALVILSAGGFVAFQNYPELSMRVAATRAGFSASLPSYQPAGFAMAGPIKYAPGEVTLNYKSSTDQRSFDVTQKNSAWDSAALLENYVVPTGKPYQTFQSSGRTIYIYDSNKATWVDGGVWYNIDGKTNLSSDQLLRIASSL